MALISFVYTVKISDKVNAGSPVFFDKYNEKIKFCSPVSGEVIDIVRGQKRRILKVVISADNKNTYNDLSIPAHNDLTRNDIIDIIQQSSDNSLDLKNNIKSHLVKMLNRYQELTVKEEKTVIVLVGVNGSGKTTTAAKLAKFYFTAGKKVTLIAADTFRAAAVDQLKIWSERVDCRFIFNEN